MNLYLLRKTSLFILMILFSVLFLRCESDPVVEKIPKEEESSPKEEDSPKEKQTEPDPEMDLHGFILDNKGAPISGVVVSDGYSCTLTNKAGFYQMKRNNKSTVVFYSTPSDYEINAYSESIKMASFYSHLTSSKEKYDFTLKKLTTTEKDFTLLCIADPQVKTDYSINRFRDETMADIKDYISSQTTPIYGLVLGDIVQDLPKFFDPMKTIMGSTDMIMHAAIGNHDIIKTSDPKTPRSSEGFSRLFGPLNYSFNRGDVHFVCLDNINYIDASSYISGLSHEQINWLREDLSYVSKDKMIIVYFHIPMRNHNNANREEFFSLLKGYEEVHLMSGHTHYNENYITVLPTLLHEQVYEHIHGAACGSFWHSTINGDGTPNGYGVYHISGSTIKEWYYKSTNYNKNFQMRLHKGNESFGGSFGFFDYAQLNNSIVVNVWNADHEWKIEAIEDGVKVGELTRLKNIKDAWALGYHLGVLDRGPNSYSPYNKHIYLHTKVNPKANLEIKATDRFGNIYTESEITSDFSNAISY